MMAKEENVKQNCVMKWIETKTKIMLNKMNTLLRRKTCFNLKFFNVQRCQCANNENFIAFLTSFF